MAWGPAGHRARQDALTAAGREQAEGGEQRVPRYVRASWAHSDLTPFVGAVEREQLESAVLASQDEQQELRAERDEMRRLGRDAEMERDTLAHANELLRADLEEAGTLARWLYRNGGQQVLDASGGGDVSEWPWLQQEDDRG